jgi:hypothetical protein
MRTCLRGNSERNLAPLKCLILNAVDHVNLILNLELTENKLNFGFACGEAFLPVS